MLSRHSINFCNWVSAALRASIVDANTTDPFIQEQAARLDYDPQRIIDFLQDEIGHESYTGSIGEVINRKLQRVRCMLDAMNGSRFEPVAVGADHYRE